MLSKRARSSGKAPEKDVSSEVSKEETPTENGEDNGKTNGETSQDGPKEAAKTTYEPARRELKPPRVLEALSASGLRALRYAREVEGIGQVVALDNDPASVEACQRNLKFNGLMSTSKVESHLTDARVHMLTNPKEFDVVDLDPYGAPSIFLDSAVQSVADGGLLMCTATDMAVLCGANGEVCYSKYGSYPLKGKYCHEMALRILLASIESHANRYKRYIVPVLSVQMDFYVRVFVRVYTSASAMKNTPLKLSYFYQCIGCDSFHLQSVGRSLPKNKSVRYQAGVGPVVPQDCTHCGKKYNMGGPIWSAPMHDQEWVASILNGVKSMKDRYPAYDKICSVLTTISEELLDVPLFLSLHSLSGTLKCTSPSAAMFRSASHANRYKRYIVPVLSVQMDFYVRVFVRVYTSASAMKNTPLKLSYFYQCIGCDSFHLQSVGRSLPKNKSVRYQAGVGPVVPQDCTHCGKKYNMGGPIWSAPMHDQEWVASILNGVKSMKDRYPAYDKICSVLTTISEELLDVPLFLSLHSLSGTLKCTSPSAAMFRSAVMNAKYRVSGSHVTPLGIKTDAPMEVIWDIMRCWVKNHPVKAQSPEHPGSVILSKEPSLQVDFSRHVGSLSKAQVKKEARFLPNPEKHWGPKIRAGRQITSKHVSLIGHEAVNDHLNGHKEAGAQEEAEGGKEEKQEDVSEDDEPELKRQKTEEDIASTS
ncbi:hypothetical protein F2Q69_00000660 [Brassica cretica]|uniref:tRNA (guanine(26)-N(2))-dimethyltransferase n=1 Tax=Brassica cretica TaxID=69181 RepID=A0A8S9PJS6_BRACR|nr:hypothetical protein F2Q69_00000660 [Brassica cretica]